MKNKFLVSLLFGTALCAGFGDAAFGASQVAEILKKGPSGVTRFINDLDTGTLNPVEHQDTIVLLAAHKDVSKAQKPKLQKYITGATAAAVGDLGSLSVSTTAVDSGLGSSVPAAAAFAPSAKAIAPAYKSYKEIRKETDWTSVKANRKFVTAFLKAASADDLTDVLRYVNHERKLELINLISEPALTAPSAAVSALTTPDDLPSSLKSSRPPVTEEASLLSSPLKTSSAAALDRNAIITEILDLKGLTGRQRTTQQAELKYDLDDKALLKELKKAKAVATAAKAGDSDND